MRDQTIVLKGLGGIWLVLGSIGLLWGVASLLTGLLGATIPSFLGGTSSPFMILPWTQIAIIACASFFVVSGWALWARYRWVQMVIVPAHLLFAVYAAVLWSARFVVQGSGPPGIEVLLAAAILANAAIALYMNGAGATEALSWLPLRTTPLIPLRCEYCGTPLDPRTNRCPECEALPEVASGERSILPPEARLISLTDDTWFEILPRRGAVVGRGSTQNAVNISNPTVSRHHAQIVYEQGRYVLTALRDLNGTFVNDALVRKRALQDGDELRFGRARFRFELVEPNGSA
jgi:hypothetical protein